MKATVKRGSRKRLKTIKEAKRDVGRRVGIASRRNYPIAETLRWIGDGERLLHEWGAIRSPFAKKVASAFQKTLTVLKTVDEVRRA
jgi:hypothetical protein